MMARLNPRRAYLRPADSNESSYTPGGHFWSQDAIEAEDDLTDLYEYLHAPSAWQAIVFQEQSIAPSLWECANAEQERAWNVRCAYGPSSLIVCRALLRPYCL